MSSLPSDPVAEPDPPRTGLSRRKLFGAAGVTAAVVGAAGAGALAGRASAASAEFGGLHQPIPFRGERQAGIITPQQDRMHFCAFDVTADNRDDVISLLRQWTEMAERMTRGDDAVPGGAIDGNPFAPPEDTGEALGLPASQLTLTIGFGPSFFEKDNDPQVAVHAIRNLARVGFGTVAVRYSQLGFGRTSSTTREQATPRNLMGFKDGTNNLKAEDSGDLDHNVWVAKGDGPDWLAGGTYLVTRRIRMRIEAWDRTTLLEQERVIGRQKGSGAPNGYRDEFDTLDFDSKDDKGNPLIDVHAHVRLVKPEHVGGVKMLRRGYNFTDGSDGFGHLDAGLFFIAFVRNPSTNFIPVQAQMSSKDALNEYITHTGTAVFACPPGLREGDESAYWGSTLFG
ncbi:MAG: Dyp-type peroxidase [Mycobacterium sp.]|nr:Dyp-type peroxidase [Mycobacterium sp.]